MSESDGIEEAIEGMTRVGLTVAGRLGEQLARAREQELRRAQAAEEQQARELQARYDAERAAARAQLAPVMDNRWWDTASGRDIERVHETATAWKDHDPAARDAAEAIRDQVQRRYGLDVDNLGADEASVAAALAKAERDRDQAEQERGTGRDETARAVQLLAQADREDRDREQDVLEENQRPEALAEEAGIKYDSAERRQELAASLQGIADREAVSARLSADQDQGTPPSAAVAKGPRRNPKAHKTHGTNGQTKLLQKGMSR
jgi:colicin import membrane protein